MQAIMHASRGRFATARPGIWLCSAVAPMSVCPSCSQPTSDPEAPFCAYCGFALPAGPAGSESVPAFPTDRLPYATGAASAQRWQPPAWASYADPRVVAVGLGALATAVLLAIGLSYAPGSGAPDHARPVAPAPGHQPIAHRTQTAALTLKNSAAPLHPPRAPERLKRYSATGYSFAYPSGWQVAQGDQQVSSYRQTVLQSANGEAKVTVDYSPGEATDPASKASQVEAATSRTPGYQRISFGPTSVAGHAAFAWDFMVADADPRRADLFITAPSGGFALLAHGLDVRRAKSAARAIAASLSAGR